MTIYLYDNNLDYSDHCIYFIESAWSKEITEKAMALSESRYTLLGTADWFVGETRSLATKMDEPEKLLAAGLPTDLVVETAKYEDEQDLAEDCHWYVSINVKG